MTRTEVLDSVQNALNLAALDAPVLVSRAEFPEDASKVIVVDVISSRPFGLDQDMSHVVQVAAYAQSVLDAEALSDAANAPLKAAGFLPGITRPAPTDDGWDGVLTDWRLP